jgi:hypothetical protein
VLIKANDNIKGLSRDFKTKLVINKALEQVRTCFFKIVKLFDSLDKEAYKRLLRR